MADSESLVLAARLGEEEKAKFLDVLQQIQRDMNCLTDDNRATRKRASEVSNGVQVMVNGVDFVLMVVRIASLNGCMRGVEC